MAGIIDNALAKVMAIQNNPSAALIGAAQSFRVSGELADKVVSSIERKANAQAKIALDLANQTAEIQMKQVDMDFRQKLQQAGFAQQSAMQARSFAQQNSMQAKRIANQKSRAIGGSGTGYVKPNYDQKRDRMLKDQKEMFDYKEASKTANSPKGGAAPKGKAAPISFPDLEGTT